MILAVPVLSVPTTFTPVLVIVTTLATPDTVIVMLLLTVGIFILLLPFAKTTPLNSEPLPTKKLALIELAPVIAPPAPKPTVILDTAALPVTVSALAAVK